MSDDDEKIEIESVTSLHHVQRVNKAKFMAMRDALLPVLPSEAPGMSVTTVMQTPKLTDIRGLFSAWNKGRIVGQKWPLKPEHVWSIRVRLAPAKNHRDLALFNMAINSKLRGCDLVRM